MSERLERRDEMARKSGETEWEEWEVRRQESQPVGDGSKVQVVDRAVLGYHNSSVSQL